MLLQENQALDEGHPVRGLSVRAACLEPMHTAHQQLSLFEDDDKALERLDFAIDSLRRRFGNNCVQRGIELTDKSLRGVDIKSEHVIHPVGYFYK